MDGLAKTVLKIDTGITLVINYTVMVEVYRCVVLMSHLPKTLLIFKDPFQQMLFLLIIYQMQ